MFTAVVESKSEVEVSSAWKVTVDFAVAVVDSVQTHSFPYGKSSVTPHSIPPDGETMVCGIAGNG